MESIDQPSYLFEVSWEVCNKVGGIHTVVSTKALNMAKEYGENHILIGPDVWRNTDYPNPEFKEEPRLFRSWKAKAESLGFRVKVGRWNIKGNPIVILVDYTTFMSQRNEIFTKFWEEFQLDSLSGQWDYIESALFGYASAKVIESFVRFHGAHNTKAIAHFHEWMTGAGVLYLRSAMPQVATVFTTHATVLGRCVAGNYLPLYGDMQSYNPDEIAHRFNVVAKQSLEKCAATNADAFTTVSDITAVECAHFLSKPVDVVTPNGFEPGFTPATQEEYNTKYSAARECLKNVATKVLGTPVAEDTVFVGIGGRYEFKNEGIDVFIDALSELKNNSNLKRNIVAYILVPGDQAGPNNPEQSGIHNLTHYLNHPQWDAVLNRMAERGLFNNPEDNVKVIFAPSYLQGNDGVFNLPYYDLLIGMDLTVFPSYYEPWGYTPMESVAFAVPTITTTLAGFGLWVNDYCTDAHPGVEVIKRDDHNNWEVSTKIANSVLEYTTLSEEQIAEIRSNAKEVSKIALWDNLVVHYKKAYELALGKAINRLNHLNIQVQDTSSYMEKQLTVNNPTWVSVMVHRNIPEKLKGLEEISKNL